METQNIKNAGVELTNSQFYYNRKITYNFTFLFVGIVIQFIIYLGFGNRRYMDDVQKFYRYSVLLWVLIILTIIILTFVFDHKTFKSIKKAGEFLMEVD